MSTLNVEIPDSVLSATRQSPEEFVNEARFLLALKLYELGRLSSGVAAQTCGMSRLEFVVTAGRMGVPAVDLDESEMEREFSS